MCHLTSNQYTIQVTGINEELSKLRLEKELVKNICHVVTNIRKENFKP